MKILWLVSPYYLDEKNGHYDATVARDHPLVVYLNVQLQDRFPEPPTLPTVPPNPNLHVCAVVCEDAVAEQIAGNDAYLILASEEWIDGTVNA
jgi:hypothetical protein